MTLLDRIMSLTDAIEERVLATDWAGATELDGQRQELLQTLFQGQPAATHDASSRTILQQLRARTDATLAAVAGTREMLAATAHQLQVAPGAVRAYESIGSRDQFGEYRK